MTAEIDNKLKELNIFLNSAFKYQLADHELLKIRKRNAQGLSNTLASQRLINTTSYGMRIFVISMVGQPYK